MVEHWYGTPFHATVDHMNGTSLDANYFFATGYASPATSDPCQPAVPQPLKGPKNAKPWWCQVIRLVTF
jgi:hypothetical protein